MRWRPPRVGDDESAASGDTARTATLRCSLFSLPALLLIDRTASVPS